MTENKFSLATWGANALSLCTSFIRRIFAHIVFLAVAVSAGEDTLTQTCLYFGGICIFPRGMAKTHEWVIPFGSGIVLAAALYLCAFPFAHAIFWGGAQSFLQRLVWKRFHMGTEWIALPFLLLPGIQLLEHTTPLLPLFLLFTTLAAYGASSFRDYFRKQRPDPKTEKTVLSTPGSEPSEPAQVAMHRASLAEFNKKLRELPMSARAAAESIAARAGGILNCMSADPRDLEPGHRFLNRYFKAAHTVVDKHAGLAREQVSTPVLEALARSEETLKRLDAVFTKEQARLLNNDVADFSADLAVIDTLLKMDGK